MFSFSGELSRTNYLRQLLVAYAVFIGGATLIFTALDALNAELPGASQTAQLLAGTLLALLIIGSLAWLYALANLMIRRVRNTAHPLRWGAVALLTPLGFVIVGFVPPARAISPAISRY